MGVRFPLLALNITRVSGFCGAAGKPRKKIGKRLASHVKAPEPVRVSLLEDSQLTGWDGPGWYFYDPEYLSGRLGDPRVAGPFSTEEAAERAYWDYCACMTI